MARKIYGCMGNKIVDTRNIRGFEVNVYGCYDKDTLVGRYEFYDVYITQNFIQHCMNEGDPYYRKPSLGELKDLVDSFLD